MRQIHRKTFVLDCFAPVHGDSARECIKRASLCSRLAKLVRGRAREKLYRLKNSNIRSALAAAPSLLEIHGDQTRYFGLLSVRLTGSDGVRVHTHENWINVA